MPGSGAGRWRGHSGSSSLVVAVAAVAVVAVRKGGTILDEFRGAKTAEVSQTPNRLADLSSSNRWTWWQEAWRSSRTRLPAARARRRSRSPAGRSERLDRDDRAARPRRSSSSPRRGSSASCSCSGWSGQVRAAAVTAVRRVEPGRARGGRRARARRRRLRAALARRHPLGVRRRRRAGVLLARRAGRARRRRRRARLAAGLGGRDRGRRGRRPLLPDRAVRVGPPRRLGVQRDRGRRTSPRPSRTAARRDGSTRSRPTRCWRSATPSRPGRDDRAALRYYRDAVEAPAGELEHLVRARLVRVLHRPVPGGAARPRPRVRARPVRARRPPRRPARPGAGEGRGPR